MSVLLFAKEDWHKVPFNYFNLRVWPNGNACGKDLPAAYLNLTDDSASFYHLSCGTVQNPCMMKGSFYKAIVRYAFDR